VARRDRVDRPPARPRPPVPARRPADLVRRHAAAPLTVTICDVGPRDGLQNEAEILGPGTRAALIDRLAAAGLPRIEAVSFVRPDLVPQMAGAEEVVAEID